MSQSTSIPHTPPPPPYNTQLKLISRHINNIVTRSNVPLHSSTFSLTDAVNALALTNSITTRTHTNGPDTMKPSLRPNPNPSHPNSRLSDNLICLSPSYMAHNWLPYTHPLHRITSSNDNHSHHPTSLTKRISNSHHPHPVCHRSTTTHPTTL